MNNVTNFLTISTFHVRCSYFPPFLHSNNDFITSRSRQGADTSRRGFSEVRLALLLYLLLHSTRTRKETEKARKISSKRQSKNRLTLRGLTSGIDWYAPPFSSPRKRGQRSQIGKVKGKHSGTKQAGQAIPVLVSFSEFAIPSSPMSNSPNHRLPKLWKGTVHLL